LSGFLPEASAPIAAEALRGGFSRGFSQGCDESALLWTAPAAEGNYLVTVACAPAAGGDACPGPRAVWAESRRLMLELPGGGDCGAAQASFAVNVRSPLLDPVPPNAPGGSEVALAEDERLSPDWDSILSLSFSGDWAPASVDVRPTRVPTLYLAGDSTVTDQASGPYASWGQMLPRFFGPGLAVANHAHSGETLKSFISSLRLAKVLERMVPGDYLLIQFGHNDQKSGWPQTYAEAGSTYKAYLRAYIAEARLRGATPILATSPQRRRFGPDGRNENTHGPYPDAVRALAVEEGLALVDLEKASRAFYEALGPERSRLAFGVAGDETHHGPYGAYELAKYAASALGLSGLSLASELRPALGLGDYDPSCPGDPAAPVLPR
jgi:lysophospholipase L1-like esterase